MKIQLIVVAVVAAATVASTVAVGLFGHSEPLLFVMVGMLLVEAVYVLGLANVRCDKLARRLELYLPGGLTLWRWDIDTFISARWVSSWQLVNPKILAKMLWAFGYPTLPGIILNRGRYVLIERRRGLSLVLTPLRSKRLLDDLETMGVEVRR